MTDKKDLDPPPAPVEPAEAGEMRTPDGPSAECDSTGSAPDREPLTGVALASTSAVRCSQCEKDVEPTIPGHCPDCGGWVFDNSGAVTLGLRSKKEQKKTAAYRVDLIDELFNERGGRDALDAASRISIENFALASAQKKTIEERLDDVGVFTQTGRRRNAFDMLKSITETIDRLRATLPPPITRSTRDATDVMPTPALELAQDLIQRQRDGDTLSQFDEGRLAVLRGAMDGEIELPPDPPPPDVPLLPLAHRPVLVEANTHEEPPAPEPPPPPASKCQYCNQSPTRCVETRKTNYPAWEVLHGRDPQVVKKKDEAATAEMLHMVGRGTPDWWND